MYCNAELIFFSDEIRAKMPQKLSKQIIESGRVVIYAAHYTCSNVDLNLILVAARTSGFIFQIIDSLMASRGVHLT